MGQIMWYRDKMQLHLHKLYLKQMLGHLLLMIFKVFKLPSRQHRTALGELFSDPWINNTVQRKSLFSFKDLLSQIVFLHHYIFLIMTNQP